MKMCFRTTLPDKTEIYNSIKAILLKAKEKIFLFDPEIKSRLSRVVLPNIVATVISGYLN